MDISRTAPPLGGSIVAAQEWRQVAFVHWRAAVEDVAPLLPPGVVPDVWGGSTWVGLIAFRLGDARIGPLPPSPIGGSFTEVNVRLYGVDDEGRRGVVFRSLEASSLPAVLAARALFSLPYMWARTAQRPRVDGWEYAARRMSASPSRRGPGFRLGVAVDGSQTVDDGLSQFLTARWGLFQRRFGRTQWLPNEHEPWVLHPASVTSLHDELCAAAGLPGIVDRAPDSVLFSPGVDARFGRGTLLDR
ncbi:YqjF family protein [Microbacterium sp. P01]|uniref:YqjF family protein n=1 Tax=unclassified Microbacterium TaxID=2609290 RepID=UPI00366B568B